MERNNLLSKIYWIFFAFVVFIGVCDFIYYYYTGYGSSLPPLAYFVRYFVFPVAVCTLPGIALRIVVAFLSGRHPLAVSYFSILMLIAGVTVLAIVHYTVSVVFLSYLLPLILSLFYNSRRLTLTCFSVSMITYLLIVFLYLPTKPSDTYKHDFVDMLGTIAIMSFLVIVAVKIISSHNELAEKLVDKTISHVSLERKVKEDPLTKLYNHAVFYDSLDMAIMSFKDVSTCFCLSVLDIDNFKTVNDRYGHVFGDKVILSLVDAIRAHTDENDMAFRYGGEEFAIISFRSLEETIATNEKIRESFANTSYKGRPDVRCTVSIGVNAYSNIFNGKREFFASADSALFSAKKDGKNKTVVVSSDNGDALNI